MGNPGSIEKVMVFGILVIILGILGIAIWSRGDTPDSNVAALGSGDGNIPTAIKPLGTPAGSDDPGVAPSGGRGFVDPPPDETNKVPAVDETQYDSGAVPIDAGIDDAPIVAPIVEDVPKPAVEPEPPAPTSYTVKSGDTLEKIARDLLGDRKHVADIQKANPGLNPQKIFVGQVIKLPAVGGSGSETGKAPAVEKSPVSEIKPKTEPNKPNAMPMTHTIQPGDNLVKISRKYYRSVDMVNPIFEANRDVIKDRNNLPVGKTIKLPKP